MTILLDVVFAFTERVPELDGLVTRSRYDLPVISTEANRQNVGGVADESAGGLASVKVPEAESVIPRCREGELAIGRDNNIRDEVVVAMKDSLGISIALFVARQLPDDDGLVYYTSKKG